MNPARLPERTWAREAPTNAGRSRHIHVLSKVTSSGENVHSPSRREVIMGGTSVPASISIAGGRCSTVLSRPVRIMTICGIQIALWSRERLHQSHVTASKQSNRKRKQHAYQVLDEPTR